MVGGRRFHRGSFKRAGLRGMIPNEKQNTRAMLSSDALRGFIEDE